MPVAMIGLSHQTAPVEVRERLAFTAPGVRERALAFLKDAQQDALGDSAECVLLSTCNRTELYVAAARLPSAATLANLLAVARDASATGDEWEAYLAERHGHRAVEHLFRVTAGLESLILGEVDIVRQIKDAYAASTRHRTAGPVLNRLFHEALRVAKKARTETDLGRGAFSVGHAAAEMAQNIFGTLAGRTVLLLGAGKMSETTARHLRSAGATSLLVANRTFDRAIRIAEALDGQAIHYESFPEHLIRTDIVIASTAAPHPIVRTETVAGVLDRRRHRPLFLIDIAVPRDIDSAVGELDDVYLYNIDDLRGVVEEDMVERRKRAVHAEILLRDEALVFSKLLRVNETATPLVTDVRAKHHEILENEMHRLRQRLPHLAATDWQAIEKFVAAVENKLAHTPTAKIREYAEQSHNGSADGVTDRMRVVRELFGLDPVGFDPVGLDPEIAGDEGGETGDPKDAQP